MMLQKGLGVLACHVSVIISLAGVSGGCGRGWMRRMGVVALNW